MGIDLTAKAWPSLIQVFRSEAKDYTHDLPGRRTCPHLREVERLPQPILNEYPVELLVLSNLSPARHQAWRERVAFSDTPPGVVLEFWEEAAILQHDGPMSKRNVSLWKEVEYDSTCVMLNSTQVGGVIDWPWLIVSRYRNPDEKKPWKWPATTEAVSRPMSNCLRPVGIPYSVYRRDLDTVEAKLRPPEPILDSGKDPMPAWPGCYIRTDKGDLARGQGTPKAWMKDVYPRGQMVRHSVAVHVFEYVSTVLTRNEEVAALDPIPMNETASSSGKPPSTNSPFVWRPLDLSEDSAWTKKRLEKLMAVAIGFLEPRPIIKQGMRILRRHRENYDSVGPRPSKLQLIWWEFPEES
jgi:hypothetical protein